MPSIAEAVFADVCRRCETARYPRPRDELSRVVQEVCRELWAAEERYTQSLSRPGRYQYSIAGQQFDATLTEADAEAKIATLDDDFDLVRKAYGGHWGRFDSRIDDIGRELRKAEDEEQRAKWSLESAKHQIDQFDTESSDYSAWRATLNQEQKANAAWNKAFERLEETRDKKRRLDAQWGASRTEAEDSLHALRAQSRLPLDDIVVKERQRVALHGNRSGARVAQEFQTRLAQTLAVYAMYVHECVQLDTAARTETPLSTFLGKDVGEFIKHLIAELSDNNPLELFAELRAQIATNRAEMDRKQRGFDWLNSSSRLDPLEMIEGALGGTVLRRLFDVVIPPPEPLEPPEIPLEFRFRGQWTIGEPGTGKTQLMQFLISRDLDLVAQGKASLVVIDPTGDQDGRLISNIIKLKRFARGGDLHGKLVYIDPSDPGYTLPINLLTLKANLADEDATTSAIDNLQSIIGGLMRQPFTDFQIPVFRFAMQVALAFPNPTLTTVRDVLSQNSRLHEEVLHKLHPDTVGYFRDVYNTEGARRSRTEILGRLYTLSSDAKFRRLFGATETKIDFFREINEPKVIVINAARHTLGAFTETYARYFLALITGAGERRASMRLGSPLPCFIYIDECDEFVSNDANAAKILLKLRGMRMALILGNQQVGRIKTADVRESFKGTAIKFVNANRDSALELAAEMNSLSTAGHPDEFLIGRPPLTFAFHVRGHMPKPIAIKVPYGHLENQRHMSPDEFADVRADIRRRYYVPLTRPAPIEVHSEEPPEPSDDPLPPDDAGPKPRSGLF